MEKKKNYSLLLIVLIPLLVYALLTAFVPTGTFAGEFTKGDISSLGLYGLFSSFITSFSVLAQNIFFLLCVGGLYGVLNKTGVYQNIVDYFSKENKKIILIVTVIIFALLSSLFGGTMFVFSTASTLFGGAMITFMLLPFFVTVLMRAGYSKVSSLAATVGATLIGTMASTTGNLAFFKNYLSLDPKNYMLYDIILLIVLMFLLCMFIITKDKKEGKKAAVKDIPLFEVSKDNKRSIVPLTIILVILLLLLVLGGYNWEASYGLKFFTNLHEKIVGIELFKTSVFTWLFGNFSQIGIFSINEACVIVFISSLIIAWVYSVKLSDFIESFKNGAKEMLIPSVYIVLASVVFTQVLTTNSNITATVINPIIKMFKDFNVFSGTLTGIVGSFFYNDSLYLINGLYGFISTFDAVKLPLIVNVLQSTFGVMMFVLPVSVLLVGGLRYLNISYKEWIKYIWIFLLQVFAISIIGNVILSMII